MTITQNGVTFNEDQIDHNHLKIELWYGFGEETDPYYVVTDDIFGPIIAETYDEKTGKLTFDQFPQVQGHVHKKLDKLLWYRWPDGTFEHFDYC